MPSERSNVELLREISPEEKGLHTKCSCACRWWRQASLGAHHHSWRDAWTNPIWTPTERCQGLL